MGDYVEVTSSEIDVFPHPSFRSLSNGTSSYRSTISFMLYRLMISKQYTLSPFIGKAILAASYDSRGMGLGDTKTFYETDSFD